MGHWQVQNMYAGVCATKGAALFNAAFWLLDIYGGPGEGIVVNEAIACQCGPAWQIRHRPPEERTIVSGGAIPPRPSCISTTSVLTASCACSARAASASSTRLNSSSLFIAVCKGGQHAHQKGVIQRDLKRSNILVRVTDAKAVPVILDFGIARAVERRLDAGTWTRHGWSAP
jgi:hypothetical protein